MKSWPTPTRLNPSSPLSTEWLECVTRFIGASALIPQKEFDRRRRRLMDFMIPNSIAIVATGKEVIRSRDTHYPFRPDSDFYYLSGFAEPEAVLALIPGRPQGEYVLFVRDRDRSREIWDGLRAGPEGACEQYGADDAFPIGDIDDILPGLLEGRE